MGDAYLNFIMHNKKSLHFEVIVNYKNKMEDKKTSFDAFDKH